MTNIERYTNYRLDRALIQRLGLDHTCTEEADRALFFGKLGQLLDSLNFHPKNLIYLQVEHADSKRMCHCGLVDTEGLLCLQAAYKQEVIEEFLEWTLCELDFSPELDKLNYKILKWELDIELKTLKLSYKLFDTRDHYLDLTGAISGLIVNIPIDVVSSKQSQSIDPPTTCCCFVELEPYLYSLELIEYVKAKIRQLYPLAEFREVYYGDLIYCEDVPTWEIKLDRPKNYSRNFMYIWDKTLIGFASSKSREIESEAYIFKQIYQG
jgi:hypothetical protein